MIPSALALGHPVPWCRGQESKPPAAEAAHALNRKSLQIAHGRNKIPEAGKLRFRPGPAPYPAGKFKVLRVRPGL